MAEREVGRLSSCVSRPWSSKQAQCNVLLHPRSGRPGCASSAQRMGLLSCLCRSTEQAINDYKRRTLDASMVPKGFVSRVTGIPARLLSLYGFPGPELIHPMSTPTPTPTMALVSGLIISAQQNRCQPRGQAGDQPRLIWPTWGACGRGLYPMWICQRWCPTRCVTLALQGWFSLLREDVERRLHPMWICQRWCPSFHNDNFSLKGVLCFCDVG
eukprot:1144409-Pelagomonas_calceolata.AAC.3